MTGTAEKKIEQPKYGDSENSDMGGKLKSHDISTLRCGFVFKQI